MEREQGVLIKRKTLSHLPSRPLVDIEFQDLTYTVPQGRKGSKIILRSISGQFRSGQLTAILGPSGAGKSTLLNILAGYKSIGATGSIIVNGQPRNMKQFQRISRYIMQEDLVQPLLTVQESMLIAADLKLSRELKKEDKLVAIEEILDVLRLTRAKNTLVNKLSGGERKRLSIALELVNNPPVIFLDEPTTGLDDLSSSQCISLLKLLAEGGRTVICSIHAPSAKLFSNFDHVYIVAAGQCMYQGHGAQIVPYLANIGLHCPKHYNPADFIVEVSGGEYGDFSEKMAATIDNGRNQSYCKQRSVKSSSSSSRKEMEAHDGEYTITYAPTTTISPYKYDCSMGYQFRILLYRSWLQTFRDSNYLLLKAVLYLFLGVILGSFYLNMGNDGSKMIFNFGFCYTCTIVFMYIPMLPVLLNFPMQVQLLKREYFNRWYGLNAYYLALTMTTLPLQLILGSLYVVVAYVMTDQPLEWDRLLMFFTICTLTAFISESLGLVISSVLSIVNGMFLGPCISVPFMLLAVYGMGQGDDIPVIIRVAMYFSYLRYSLEGLLFSVYGNDRPKLPCPEEETMCYFTDPKALMVYMGMRNVIFWVDLVALIVCFLAFRAASFYLLRQRLRPNKTFAALQVIGRIIKSHFNLTR